MKREADAEMGPSTKRTRSGDDIDVRLLIPSKVRLLKLTDPMEADFFIPNACVLCRQAAGSVIGKGGHNITKLRTEVST